MTALFDCPIAPMETWSSQKPPSGVPLDPAQSRVNGLTSLMAFQAGSGSAEGDAAESRYVANITNGTWAATSLGMAMRFNGTNSYLDLRRPVITGNDFSIVGLIRLATKNTYEAIASQWGGGQAARFYLTVFGNKLYYVLGGAMTFGVSATLTQGAWTSFALVRRAGVISYYLNGVQGGTNGSDATLIYKANTFLGAISSGVDQKLSADVAYVGIYGSRAIHPQEIMDWHLRPYDVFASGGIPSFDSGVARPLIDGSLVEGGISCVS